MNLENFSSSCSDDLNEMFVGIHVNTRNDLDLLIGNEMEDEVVSEEVTPYIKQLTNQQIGTDDSQTMISEVFRINSDIRDSSLNLLDDTMQVLESSKELDQDNGEEINQSIEVESKNIHEHLSHLNMDDVGTNIVKTTSVCNGEVEICQNDTETVMVLENELEQHPPDNESEEPRSADSESHGSGNTKPHESTGSKYHSPGTSKSHKSRNSKFNMSSKGKFMRIRVRKRSLYKYRLSLSDKKLISDARVHLEIMTKEFLAKWVKLSEAAVRILEENEGRRNQQLERHMVWDKSLCKYHISPGDQKLNANHKVSLEMITKKFLAMCEEDKRKQNEQLFNNLSAEFTQLNCNSGNSMVVN